MYVYNGDCFLFYCPGPRLAVYNLTPDMDYFIKCLQTNKCKEKDSERNSKIYAKK